MKWSKFLERYEEWSPETLKRRFKELEDIGTSYEVLIVAETICENKINKILVGRALNSGIIFSQLELIRLAECLDREFLESVLEYSISKGVGFSVDEILELEYYVSSEFITYLVKAHIENPALNDGAFCYLKI